MQFIAGQKRKKKKINRFASSERFNVVIPFRFRVVSGMDQESISGWGHGEIRNISEGGIMILTDQVKVDGLHIYMDESHDVKNLMEVEIHFKGYSIVLKGDVRWYDRCDDNEEFGYKAGVKFIETGEEDRILLQNLVCDVAKGSGFFSRLFSFHKT